MDTNGVAAVLRRAGVLGDHEPHRLEVLDVGAFNSQTVRVRVEVPDVSEALTFVLKRPADGGWSRTAAAEESRFYRTVAAATGHPEIVPRCFAIGPADDPFVLLEDLSATHRPPLTRTEGIEHVLASEADQVSVIDTLARLKAFWWEHPLQEQLGWGYWSEDVEGFEHYAQRRRASWQKVLADNSAWLPAHIVDLCNEVVDGLTTHWTRWLQPRLAGRRQLTLLHGDAYFANFLCPQPGTAGHAYLIDWQSACIDIGAGDLVNLMATFWTSEQRNSQGRERRLLEDFHRRLTEYGVTDYSLERLENDYRIGLVYWILMPIQDAYDGSPVEYWWPKLQCLASAFDDWQCRDLLR
jgi:thiamine kinase-like enzyme